MSAPRHFFLSQENGQPLVLPIKKSYPALVYSQKVKRTVMLVAVSLIVFYVINQIVATAITFGWAAASSDFTSALESLLGSSAGGNEVDLDSATNSVDTNILGIASIASIVLGSLAFLIVRGPKMYSKDLVRTAKGISLKELLVMVAVMGGVQAIFTLVQIMLFWLLDPGSFFAPPTDSVDPFMMYLTPFGLLYVVLIGPIFEEIMFRGAVLRSLEPYGQNFAIVLSSLLFGVYHLFLFQSIFAFFVGLILAYCTIHYSIKWAVLLHILNNAFSSALLYFGASFVFQLAAMFVLLAIFLAVLLPTLRRLRVQRKMGRPAPLPVVSQCEYGHWAQVAAVVKARPFSKAFTTPLLLVGLSISLVLMVVFEYLL